MFSWIVAQNDHEFESSHVLPITDVPAQKFLDDEHHANHAGTVK